MKALHGILSWPLRKIPSQGSGYSGKLSYLLQWDRRFSFAEGIFPKSVSLLQVQLAFKLQRSCSTIAGAIFGGRHPTSPNPDESRRIRMRRDRQKSDGYST
ncbi:hypothetical protein RY831_01960 [Noviherbaspirillum sp. CPCC 100848]|uniref:Uncharacterized protein n=1 Tax=Noviherbaspirillum album TaxID=3080276 RepID=A0ABU6J2R5_9BURK|nr:hypothetical protein [Noviherbaspirillum sp. CPCC 100848]MEC4717904.1 hypothetical protein [Noviherbaspirillum sp. CPCC 100848]